ncbi:hypothetical protein EJB05_42743, partial [Eragrostis curvula]
METETRRWAATYTKHLKQKRKAYHDGALLLHPDSGRLVLLDDAGDTLESRYIRSSEEVSTGAALSFHSYLVDVGEPEACPAGSRSSSSSNSASRTAHRGGARARPPSAAGRLNPRVPRAFANPPKSGGEGEAAGAGGVDSEGSRFQEWTALYTAQLTQKAKKYHDGIVRLIQAGPHVKQVRSIAHLMVVCSIHVLKIGGAEIGMLIVLLDEDGQVLGSRHLKSGESIESGKKCIFPNYLIEICEAKNEKEGTHASAIPMVHRSTKSWANSTSNKMGLSAVSKSQKFISPQNFHDHEETKSEVTASSGKPEAGNPEVVAAGSSGSLMGTDSSLKEWNALYTTQLTQKAKKYHDGIIRLIQVGSHARQIVLLDEDGGVLGSRYLKSVESVESGTKCQIPNYLIEVSELRNEKNEGKHSLEEVTQAGQRSEENKSEKTGAKSKSPKFVSPFKCQDVRKRSCESTTSSIRPLIDKTTRNNMNGPPNFHVPSNLRSGKSDSDVNVRADHCKSTFDIMDGPLKFNDMQRGPSANFNWPEVGKSWSSSVVDPPKFHDPQDGKSGCPSNFIRREVGKSTSGNMDDSIRTASQIISIMKPPSEVKKRSQCAPSGAACSLVSSDASCTNNSVVDNSNRTFDGSGHSGLSHFATQLRTSVQSCLSLDVSRTNNSVVDDSNKTFDGRGHSGLAHFATQLRTSVQSCLSLEIPQRKNSVTDHQWNELPGNSLPTQDIMRPTASESQDLAMVDILASGISNAKEQNRDSNNHHMESSNDTVPSDPGLQDDKRVTADQLSTQSSAVDGKCDRHPSTSAYTLTCKDPRIQELIDDCPSFDLGF